MANRFGIDAAQILSNIENIKGSRIRNQMAGLQLGEAQRLVAERPEKERLAQERQANIFGLREKAVEGDVEAQKRLLVIDPEGGASFIASVDKMGDREREQAKQNIAEMGSMTATILQAPEERRPQLYQEMLKMLPQESLAKMPQQYDPDFLEVSLGKLRAMDDILQVKSVSFGGEDILVKGGREVSRAKKPVKKTGTGAGRGLKSADESLMYRQSAELLGGIFDQQGNITNLDPQTRNIVQAIATRATKIYQEKGNISRTEAVTLAAKEGGYDIKLPSMSETNVSDPNSIRQYLLNN